MFEPYKRLSWVQVVKLSVVIGANNIDKNLNSINDCLFSGLVLCSRCLTPFVHLITSEWFSVNFLKGLCETRQKIKVVKCQFDSHQQKVIAQYCFSYGLFIFSNSELWWPLLLWCESNWKSLFYIMAIHRSRADDRVLVLV